MNVLCKYVKFHAWEMITKGDILVKKKKVKKINFLFTGFLISHGLFTNVYINTVS